MALITTQTLAKRLDCDPATVCRWLERGLIKAEKLGNTWVIDESALVGFERPRAGRPKRNLAAPQSTGPGEPQGSQG